MDNRYGFAQRLPPQPPPHRNLPHGHGSAARSGYSATQSAPSVSMHMRSAQPQMPHTYAHPHSQAHHLHDHQAYNNTQQRPAAQEHWLQAPSGSSFVTVQQQQNHFVQLGAYDAEEMQRRREQQEYLSNLQKRTEKKRDKPNPTQLPHTFGQGERHITTPGPLRVGSAEGEAEVLELSRWMERMDEFDQQCQLYQMDYVEPHVWSLLKSQVHAARAEVTCSQTLMTQMDTLLDKISAASSSHDSGKSARFRTAEEGLQRVRTQMEEGEFAHMSLPQYDDLIATVATYQQERELLMAEGIGHAGMDLNSSLTGDELVQTLRGFKQSISENGLLIEEEAFAARLTAQQFVHLPAPTDGDCLYHRYLTCFGVCGFMVYMYIHVYIHKYMHKHV